MKTPTSPACVISHNCHRFPGRLGAGLLLWLTALALLAWPARAATRNWSGAGGNANWSTDANWGGTQPASGDIVVFPAGAARLTNTNDISGLRLKQIKFTGAGGGYLIRGSALTLTNGISAENTAGFNSLFADLHLDATQTFRVVSGAALYLYHIYVGGSTLTVDSDGDCYFTGSLMESGQVIKTGAGLLEYRGSTDNLFNGQTWVKAGTLNLAKMNPGAIQFGSLIVGETTGAAESAVVVAASIIQIEPEVAVTIRKSGLLTLNGNYRFPTLTLNGGVLETGAPWQVTLSNLVNNATAGSPGVVRGTLNLPEHVGIEAAGHLATPDLRIEAQVVGPGGFNKWGTGTLALTSSNSFAGEVSVQQGVLQVLHARALGTTNRETAIASNGSLWVADGVTAIPEPLQMQGTNALQFEHAGSWNGTIELTASAGVAALGAGGTATLNGLLYGAGTLSKYGPGTVRLASSVPGLYSGDTHVREGTLEMSCSGGDSIPNRLIIGGAGADATAVNLANYEVSTVTVAQRGTWNLNGMKDNVSDLILDDGGDVDAPAPGELFLSSGATVMTSFRPSLAAKSYLTGVMRLGGPVEFDVGQSSWLGTDPSDLEITATIGGTGGITKSGSGDLELASSNSFSGVITVTGGELRASDSHALSATAPNGVTLSGGAVLRLSGGITVTNEPLTINSTGTASQGALDSSSGSNVWTGPIELQRDSVVSVATNVVLQLGGAVSGVGGLAKTGPGLLGFFGPAANTYGGVTTVREGALSCKRTTSNVSVPGDLIIGEPGGGSSATVRLDGTIAQINNDADVTVHLDGVLAVNGSPESIGSLAGDGSVVLNDYLWTGYNHASTVFSGVISGSGGLSKYGTGTFTLDGNNTYTGDTVVQAGTLLVNGQQRNSPVTVATTARLGGVGDVGNLVLDGSGDLAPGASVGQFGCSNLVFNAGTLEMELRGPVPGTSHDNVFVRGTVNLNATLLGATLGYAPVAGDVFTLIYNDGADAVTGTFNGLPDGATTTIGGIPMQISYFGGDGNDVTLTVSALPLAAARAYVIGGNGNASLDPNECNHLYIVVSNSTASALSGRRATLSTTTPGVIITKGDALYPAIPAGGSSTNDSPFQISLEPGFVCTTPVDLLVALAAVGEPLFSVSLSLPTGVPGTPVRFDNATAYPIPDRGSVTSAVTVASFTAPIAKATVSLHAVHATDSQLGFRLIAPDGTVILLSEGNGGTGDNYGTDCAPDSRRTTFDDGAKLFITAGSAPFAASYRPEEALSALIGKSGTAVNGTWKLVATDNAALTTGSLECWSLMLAPLVCPDGGGTCATCYGAVNGGLGAGNPTLSQRILRDGDLSTGCGIYQQCPGWVNAASPLRYAVHWFTNTGSSACITVVLGVPCAGSSAALQATAYSTAYDPALPCTNYLADTGISIYGGSVGMSFFTAPGARFGIVVNEIFAGSGCASYTLAVYGTPCPPPALEVSAGTVVGRARVQWPTSAAGYELQRTAAVDATPSVWSDVTTSPTVVNGKFTVTNTTPDSPGFFRLRKE